MGPTEVPSNQAGTTDSYATPSCVIPSQVDCTGKGNSGPLHFKANDTTKVKEGLCRYIPTQNFFGKPECGDEGRK